MAVTEAAEDETVYYSIILYLQWPCREKGETMFICLNADSCILTLVPQHEPKGQLQLWIMGVSLWCPGFWKKCRNQKCPIIIETVRGIQNILANKIRKFGGLIFCWNVARRSTCKRCRADAERRPAACKQPKCWLTAAPTAAGSTYCSPASENTLQRHLSKGLLGDTTVVMDTRPASAHAINDE